MAEERTHVGNGDTMLENFRQFREGVYGFPEWEFILKLSEEDGRKILEKLRHVKF